MNQSNGGDLAEQWDHLFNALSAEPRRAVIRSLLEVPRERRLPLPEAAESPNHSIDSETLAIQLRHQHLPMLADLGYVRWETDPFCVQRGPDFEHPAFLIEMIENSLDEMPESLLNDCEILRAIA